MGCAAEARETAAGQDKRKLFRDEARCLEALLALSDAKSGTVWRSAARCLAELCSFGNAPPPQRHHPPPLPPHPPLRFFHSIAQHLRLQG